MNNDVSYPYTEAEIAAFSGGTNWIDEVTRDGFLHNESLNITGGSEKTQYLFSMSNLDNKAVIKGNDFNRFTMRLNLDQKFNNWIKGNVSLSFSRNKLDNIYGEGGRSGGAQFAGVIASSLEFNPVLPIRDEDGKYVLNPDRTNRPNPVSFLDAQDKSKRDDIFGTASIELTPIKNLMIKGTVGANLRNNERKSYLPSTISIGNQASMYAYVGENKNENYLVNLLADYKFNLGEKHSFGIMGAFEYENKEQFGTTMVNSDFPSDDFLWNNMGAGAMTRPEVTSYLIGEERASYIARFNYAFNNKYLLTANLRVDGSSNFAENKQWGVFPGVSAAWRITEEPFLQNNKVINDLKLRAGYGRVGNDGNLTGTYSYLGTKYYAFNKIPTAGLGMEKIGNPDLSWETKDNYNVGLDWGLFKGRLSGSVDFYYSRITNLIGQRQLPINMEVNTMDYNLSQVDGNKGVDFNISSVNFHNKDFKWSTDIVFSYYRNFYIRRDANYVLGINEKQRQDKGGIWQYEIDGLVPAGETNAGAIKVKDVNGYLRDENGNIVMVNGKPAYSGSPDGKVDEADLQYFGNNTPIPFSINNSFEYKNFDLNIYLYGMLNNWQSNATYRLFSGNMENVYTYGENTLAKLKDRWSYDNMNSTTPSIFATAVSSGQVQRFYYEKASFLRCENITLGYTLPKKLTSKVFSSVRLYATARNLFVITPYSGSDPETDSQAAYPNQRTYTFGIDIKF
jgi:TonB-linked SusC/RagA family outer membrane protein